MAAVAAEEEAERVGEGGGEYIQGSSLSGRVCRIWCCNRSCLRILVELILIKDNELNVSLNASTDEVVIQSLRSFSLDTFSLQSRTKSAYCTTFHCCYCHVRAHVCTGATCTCSSPMLYPTYMSVISHSYA